MDCLVFVCVRVGEAFDLAGFTSEEAVEVGSDLVSFAFAKGVTLGASCLRRRVLDHCVVDVQLAFRMRFIYLEEIGTLLVISYQNN